MKQSKLLGILFSTMVLIGVFSSSVFARDYDPTTGRFTKRDPIEYVDDNGRLNVNLYTYVKNNPVNKTDPTGMVDLDLGLGAGIGSTIGKAASSLVETDKKCPEGYIWTEKPGGEIPDPDGCSVPWWLEWLIPGDKDAPVYGISFKDACDNHDKAYSKCGGKNEKYTGKEEADLILYAETLDACGKGAKHSRALNECSGMAQNYYLGVRLGGWDAFKTRQDKNCHCAPDPNPKPQQTKKQPVPSTPKTQRQSFYRSGSLRHCPSMCDKYKDHPEMRPKD